MVKYSYDRRGAYPEKPTFRVEAEVVGFDAKDSLVKLLQFLKFLGDAGGSRGLRTEDNDTIVSYWDGDGPDRIKQILVNGEPLEKILDDKKSKLFNKAIR